MTRHLHNLNEDQIAMLRRDLCADCGMQALKPGPRGGAGQNLLCERCGAGFNVAFPRYVIWAQRIRKER